VSAIGDIRVALADAVNALGAIQASPYILANPTPPYAHVLPSGEAGPLVYDLTMGRGLDQIPFTVEVFTGSPVDVGAQMLLDEYLEPTGGRSIKAALEVDKTLGGLVDTLHVTQSTGYHAVVFPHRGQADPLLVATWHLTIYMRGDGT
jgi:hypothetical protein